MLSRQRPWLQLALALGVVAVLILALEASGALDALGHWVIAMQAEGK